MMRILVFLLACLTVAGGPLSAGDPAADFNISASVFPGTVTPPGTEGVITISITNLGPDDGTPLFSMQRTDDGSGLVNFPPLHFEFPGALLTGSCITVPLQRRRVLFDTGRRRGHGFGLLQTRFRSAAA